MCAISAIPTTRLSNQFMALRTLMQIQSDQRGLLTVQDQISSGRRINLPSEDVTSAGKAMILQSLIERKSTIGTGLSTIETYLSSTESAVGDASQLLSDVRATALSVSGNSVGQAERDAAVVQVNSQIDQLLSIANQNFKGRYLFAGSQTQSIPFVRTASGAVSYRGNDDSLPIFSDINQLYQSNVTGNAVFGALSTASQSTTRLNPALSFDTPLANLNGGNGIRAGSVAISDGSTQSVVSIAGAQTIGDVARILEAHAPTGRTLTARVSNQGLEISLDGGNLSIDEVGSGTTAAELGIRHSNGTGPGPVVGTDLNPRATLTTRIADVFGTRSRAYLPALNGRNDLIVEANSSGAANNGVTFKYVDDGWYQAASGITAGNEFATFHATATAATAVLNFQGRVGLDKGIQLTARTAGAAANGIAVGLSVRTADGLGPQLAYNSGTKGYTISVEAGTTEQELVDAIHADSSGVFDAALVPSIGNGAYVFSAGDTNSAAGNTYLTGDDANTLAVHIAPNKSTANQAIAAINALGTFTARLDPSEEGSDGNGTIVDSVADANAVAVTSGGGGVNFDRTGLRINNGGQTFNIDFTQATTIEDVLNSINGSGAEVVASLNATGTGIDIRSRLSGTTFSIGENGGTTATQLGVRTLTTATALASLNGGSGVRTLTTGDDFTITRRDGTTYGISLSQGVEASARIGGGVVNSALLVSRVQPGTAGNAFQVQIVDSGSGGGNSVALVGNTLQFSVDVAAGFTAQQSINLLAADSTLSPQFTAQLDKSTDVTNDGSGNLAATSAVNFSGGKGAAVTVGDVLDLINNDPANLVSGPPVVARLAQFGNGIELSNDGPPSTATLAITKGASSSAAVDLGLVSDTTGTSAAPSTSGSAQVLTGADVNRQQVDGIFTSLIHLRDAIASGDQASLQAAVDQLDQGTANLTFTRSSLGTRLNGLDIVKNRLEAESVTLKSALSDEIDVDYTKAISDLAQRQAAYQAALQIASELSKKTLLDFL